MKPNTIDTLYISDLDGTLLQPDATLAPDTRERLTRLLVQGLPFTVASARSIVSIREILGDLPLQLPVIHYNGGFLTDYVTDHHHFIETIPPGLAQSLVDLAAQRGLSPMISTHTGRETWIYHQPPINAGMQWYKDDRANVGDQRLRETPDLNEALAHPVVAMTLIDTHARLAPFEQQMLIHAPQALRTHLYENMYNRPWNWLSFHPWRATKAHAIERLLDHLNLAPTRLTVFGDHDNDIPMFKLAHNAIAVANATDKLKAHAHHQIPPNHTGSVIDYIENDWPGPSAPTQ